MGKLFGTDGLRGIAGEYPLDNATVELLGRIFYYLLLDRKTSTEIIIGRDTRESGPILFAALCRGFTGAGGRVHDAGVMSTPSLAYLARANGLCAISITASHNAYVDNGIKIFGPDGYKLSDQAELEIEPYLLGEKTFARSAETQSVAQAVDMHEQYVSSYCDYLAKSLFPDLDLHGTKIALDCANGALSEIAPRVIRHFGGHVVAFHIEPNGRNINDRCGSLHPEVLFHEVKIDGFDCGFTFDGDGDRCLTVDSEAIYDGDFILAAASRYLQSRNELKKNAVVATSMSNLGLEIFLRKLGITLHRVPVGDKNVLEKLEQEQLSLGGEQSGHIIFKNDTFIGDGLITALQLLRIYKNLHVPFSHLCDGFIRCPQVLVNVAVRSKPELKSIPEIHQKMNEIEQQLNGSGRMLVRYSGTEMLARVMLEGTDQNTIESMANELGELIRNKLN
jgi:phosphoglucosamine mutase